MTLDTPNTAPNAPWYLPRSLAGTMSPMIAWVSTIRPPPPTPWTARKAMSSPMFRDWPQRADPMRKITIAPRNRYLRPYWSPSLPHTWVVAVLASRYAVTTQDRWLSPPRSLTIVGSAVDTIVWSREASSSASISAM